MDLRASFNSPINSNSEMPKRTSEEGPLLKLNLPLGSTDSQAAGDNSELFVETSSNHGEQHSFKKIILSNSNATENTITTSEGEFKTEHEPSVSASGKPKRRSSDAYPFSTVHLQRHESNVETGFYEVKNFEEHLVFNLSDGHHPARRHSRHNSNEANSVDSNSEAHPEILEKREKKFRGRSMSQPHMPALVIPEDKKKKSAYNDDPNEPIKTEKVPSKTFKQRRRSFLGMLACSSDKK
jgi:hypothetical protein